MSGALPEHHAASLTLEVPLYGGPETIEALRSSLPPEESPLFLRSKGAADGDTYRLVVMRGVIVNRDGLAEVLPGDEDFLSALDGMPFDAQVAEVRIAGR